MAVLSLLALTVVVGPAPRADAIGAAPCTITGTIRFTPAATGPDQGTWDIAPAVIHCRGIFNVIARMGEHITGHGSFTGTGSYVVRHNQGGCLPELGSGTVDYWIPTDHQDVHMQEANTFLLTGAGAFTTETLYGTFQTLYEGNCLVAPVTRALFVAEVSMVRTKGAWK